VDIVEAFTPPPNGNLSVKEARRRRRGKALSINVPSFVIERSLRTIAETLHEVR
jgi:hypothetical protein